MLDLSHVILGTLGCYFCFVKNVIHLSSAALSHKSVICFVG